MTIAKDRGLTLIEIGFLRRLAAGVDYVEAAQACGEQGLRVAFQATLNGWVDRGGITPAGRALIMPAIRVLAHGGRS